MGFDFSSAASGASVGSSVAAGSSFGPWGALAGGILGGFFGGGSKGPSAAKQMQMQLNAQYELAKNLPSWQVNGLRNAGLNPILAVTHGLPQGQMPTSGVVDDRVVDINAASAKSQIMNQMAQAKLFNAQAEKTEAETETELHRPMNVAADTGSKMAQPALLAAQTRQALAAGDLAGATQSLQQQLQKTEEWKTRTATVETFLKNFEYELSLKNLPPRQMAEIRKLTAEARSAETDADLNEAIRGLERSLGMAGQVAGTARAAAGARRLFNRR